jgi:hypothetical protein
MLKFQYAINLGLATVLVVPAVTLGAGENPSLEQLLSRTVAALEELAGIERRLHERDPAAIHDALQWTEAPLALPSADPGARDELLTGLRGEVARLQRDVDRLGESAVEEALDAPAGADELAPEGARPEDAPRPATVGLDEGARRWLGSRPRPAPEVVAAPPTSAPAPEAAPPGAKRAFEAEGYAADALKLGRAHYRQGRYEVALETFRALADAEGQYWKARCLEKLGRSADAIAAYGAVIAREDAGYLAERAAEDLDFLQWRLAFESSRAKNGGKTP